MSEVIIEASKGLVSALEGLNFSDPVTHVYNPLDYAWEPHAQYLRRFATGKKRVLFMGMNPGPFGMAQTGVPFGEIAAVSDWMGINALVPTLAVEHPKGQSWDLVAQNLRSAVDVFGDSLLKSIQLWKIFLQSTM